MYRVNMKKKSKSNNIDKVPFDCWTTIVSFFNNKKDFISIILCIKGLFEYIKKYSPQCTEGCVFTLKKKMKFPEKQPSYVTNVEFLTDNQTNAIEDLNTFLKENRYEDVNDIFDKILEHFPNLKRLHFTLGYLYREICERVEDSDLVEEDFKAVDWPLSNLKLNFQQVSSLKILRIAISSCNLTISQKFPLIEQLDLSSIGYFLHEDDCDNEYNDFENIYDLEIDWSCFPKIQELILLGWKLKNSLTPLKDRLKLLELDHVVLFNDDNLKGFTKLTFLEISYSTISSVKTLENLSSLSSLVVNYRTKGENWLDSEDSYYTYYDDFFFNGIYFSLHNMPNLKSIRMFGKNIISKLYHTKKELVLSNLPKLEEVILDLCTFSINVSKTPNLMNLKMSNYYKGDVFFEERKRAICCVEYCDKIKLKTLILEGCQLSDDFMNTISQFKELEKVDIKMYPEEDEPDDGHIISFDNLQKLKVLKYRSASACYDQSFLVENVTNCKELEILKIRNPANGFEISGVPKLKKVSFYGLKRLKYDENGNEVGLVDFSRNIKTQIGDQLKDMEHIEEIFFEPSDENQ